MTLADRFWSKVEKQPGDGCWLWTGARMSRNRYGHISVGGRAGGMVGAHRVSWELHFGPIPDGLEVLHSCDNPPCVRPAHLFLGTQATNIVDMDTKGRGHRVRLVGEQHGMAKLTRAQAMEIRRLHARGHQISAIAKQFGVTWTTIKGIVIGRLWASLQDEPILLADMT